MAKPRNKTATFPLPDPYTRTCMPEAGISRRGTNDYIFTSSLYEFVSVWDCGDVFSEDLHHNLITGIYINGLEHYNDIIMRVIASQVTSLPIAYSTVYLGADKRKHQSSVSLAFVQRIHRRPVNSPHTGPVMQKMFPFDDVIMAKLQYLECISNEVILVLYKAIHKKMLIDISTCSCSIFYHMIASFHNWS